MLLVLMLRPGKALADFTVIVTSPDELLSEAAAKMLSARIGRLPVVDPTDPTKLIGYLAAVNSSRVSKNHIRKSITGSAPPCYRERLNSS
jgi:CBS domain-containing protein